MQKDQKARNTKGGWEPPYPSHVQSIISVWVNGKRVCRFKRAAIGGALECCSAAGCGGATTAWLGWVENFTYERSIWYEVSSEDRPTVKHLCELHTIVFIPKATAVLVPKGAEGPQVTCPSSWLSAAVLLQICLSSLRPYRRRKFDVILFQKF